MINSLTLKSFQIHQDRTIKLDPEITVLTGLSDSGKTAFLRCLRWICTNKPSGEEFLRHGDKEVVGILSFYSHTLTRKKGKENTYSLDNKEFKAFGQGVPQEILDLLNLDEGINFQTQLEAPFWFLKSPGEVSKELNKIVNLERIDEVLSKASSLVRKNKLSVEISEERLQEAKQEEDKLSWVEQAHQEYQPILTLQEEIASRRTRMTYMASGLEEARKVASRREILSQAILEASQWEERLLEVRELLGRVSKLEGLLERIRVCQQSMNTLTTERNELAQSLKEVMRVCPLCGR